MQSELRICVLIPVYNHCQTVAQVVRAAQAIFPVIVVDDGSTDGTADALHPLKRIIVLGWPTNQGKGAALLAGFRKAEQLGFTHAITIDADGQHSPAALGEFALACRRSPAALVVGVRELRQAGAPWRRRITNQLSNVCYRLETGRWLPDTQCGYRCYPLAACLRLPVSSGRYGFELEMMVKAAWAGLPLMTVPVPVDYSAPTSRLSHFHPLRDLAHLAWLHLRLLMQSVLVRP